MLNGISHIKDDVNPNKFTDINGDLKDVTMMKSNEIDYIFDDYAKGFIRPYKDENIVLLHFYQMKV